MRHKEGVHGPDRTSRRATTGRLVRAASGGVLALGTLGLTAVLAAGPAGAAGTTLYASANGGSAGTANGNCQSQTSDPSQDCSLAEALDQIGAGGTIELVTPGSAGVTSSYYESENQNGFSVETTGTSAADPITIEPAPGVTSPILDGQSQYRVLTVGSSASTGVFFDLSGVTVENGSNEFGGGIANNQGGTLTVTDCTFLDNSAPGGLGGAIDNADDDQFAGAGTGTAIVTGSTFSGNTAYFDGGAIDNGDSYNSTDTDTGQGILTVTGSTFSDNTTSTDGGAIDNGDNGGQGTLTVSGSTFSDNTTVLDGGAIDNGADDDGQGTVTVSGSTFSGNAAYDGGALYNGDAVTVTGSTFSGNMAGSNGGAMDNGDYDGPGNLTVSRSTFSGNMAGSNGGAVDNGDDGGQGTFTASGSTFSDNTAGGDGAIIDSGDTTIVADLFEGSCNQSSGTWTDDGYNVGSDATCFNTTGGNGTGDDSTAGSNLVNLLGPLAGNGGLTDTIALLSGNPAIDLVPEALVDPASSVAFCSGNDQRGAPRLASGAGTCDAGAVQQGSLIPQSITFATTAPAAATVGGPTYAPAASATSGLAVAITLDPASTGCAISGGVVTFTAAGTCVLDANQAGNQNYGAAPQVQQATTVTGGSTPPPPPATIPSASGGSHLAALPSGTGYWVVNAAGTLTAYGTATSYGSMAGQPLNAPIVGIAATPDGKGYWLVGSDGGVFAFGDAAYYGSMGGHPLNQPVVGIASTPSGSGYWLVAADGGIFSFGGARFSGSMGGHPLNQPVVAMTADPAGGYWLVASDGGVFSFGGAVFHGSAGAIHLNKPVVGLAAAPDGGGYWLVASDGGVFTYGDAGFFGSLGGSTPAHTVIGLFSTSAGAGYTLVDGNGTATAF